MPAANDGSDREAAAPGRSGPRAITGPASRWTRRIRTTEQCRAQVRCFRAAEPQPDDPCPFEHDPLLVTQRIATGKAEHAISASGFDTTASNALISSVQSGTPAAKGRAEARRRGHLARRHEHSSPEELASVTSAHKPGDKVTVTDERDGQSHSIQLTLATRPS